MPYTSDIERLNYYEGEYLGALDFAAEQEYHREMRRRHNVGQHTWGIVSGLDLAQIPNGQITADGLTEVDVYVQPGMAVDGFGREIVVLSRTQLTEDLFAAFYDPNAASARNMYIWIAYDQQLAQLSGDACTRQNTSNPYSRVQESFRLLVTSMPTPVPPLNDPLVIDGNTMTPPAEPAVPPPPPPTPTPGDIVLPYDGSVPYQEFAQDDTTVHWYVLLGQVLWHPQLQVLVQTAAAAAGRQYCGAVAATIEAPNAQLVIQDRLTPSPLPADPHYSGVAVEVQGTLTVDRLLTALDDILTYEHHRLIFAQSDGTDGDTPLWIRRYTNSPGADLHIHIGDTADSSKRLTVGFGKIDDPQQIVFDVRSDGKVEIPTGSLEIPTGSIDFGQSERQMLNLWNTAYGIGIQDFTEYFRSDADFCWFKGGQHSNTRSDPGSGGTLAMKLDNSSSLTVAGNAVVNGSVGIGTATPATKVHVVGDRIRLESADGTRVIDLRADGSAVDLQSQASDLYLRSSGGFGKNRLILNPWDGNVGIGTTSPGYLLDVADRMCIRSGASGSAGVWFYQSDANQNRAFVGMLDDNNVGFYGSVLNGFGMQMDVTNGNVGIGITPTKKLSVNGSVRVVANIGTNDLDPDDWQPPLGGGGGIHTDDVYAEGDVYAVGTVACKLAKQFVIDHPEDPEGKHLVHATLEGPEVAVFYRGEARLAKGKATITLPDYFEALTRKENRTVLLTPKFKAGDSIATLAASDITKGKFTVHSAEGGNATQEFFWEVKAVRSDVNPLKVELPKRPGTGRKNLTRSRAIAKAKH